MMSFIFIKCSYLYLSFQWPGAFPVEMEFRSVVNQSGQWLVFTQVLFKSFYSGLHFECCCFLDFSLTDRDLSWSANSETTLVS